MSYPARPHFALPLRFAGGRAVVVEQDTPADVAACVEVVLRTPAGHLEANPRFGAPDLAFTTGGPDAAELVELVARHEPRAQLLADEDPDALADVSATVRLRLQA